MPRSRWRGRCRAAGGSDGLRAKYTRLPRMIASKAWRKLMSTDGLDTIEGILGCPLFMQQNGEIAISPALVWRLWGCPGTLRDDRLARRRASRRALLLPFSCHAHGILAHARTLHPRPICEGRWSAHWRSAGR